MRRATLLCLVSLLLCTCRTTGPAPAPEQLVAEIRSLRTRPDIAAATAFVMDDRETIVGQWRELTEIPAPSGQEARRAERVEELVREAGLDVRRDAAGNVLATRRGTGGGRHVVLDAHLDTVFPMDTDVTVRLEGDTIAAPGVGDDTRNVVALLAMLRAMQSANVMTRGDVTFLFSVREETDFGGIRQFLADHAGRIDRFVALDGGYGGFTYGGTGTYWYRYHIVGPGGHTRSPARIRSAAAPLARAIARVYELDVPRSSWLNIGMLGGSDVINAKAGDAWCSVDIRSTDPESLRKLDAAVARIFAAEAAREGMTVRPEVISKEEVAALPGHRDSAMVATSEAVWRAFDFDPEITNTASNHSSAALRAGIPAISTGTTRCSGAHSLDERCEIEPIFIGIQRMIALAVALAE